MDENDKITQTDISVKEKKGTLPVLDIVILVLVGVFFGIFIGLWLSSWLNEFVSNLWGHGFPLYTEIFCRI